MSKAVAEPSPAALLQCVAAFRAEPRGHAELEIRLGVHSDSRFVAGVPREVFEQLCADMQEAPELEADDKWSEIVDYHYAGARGKRVRSRVAFDSQAMTLQTTHTVKEGVGDVVLRRAGAAADDHEACRIAWALETPVEGSPDACVPTYVRIKQRKCFRDRRGGAVVWSYEMSKTWAASSRSVVEHLQHVSAPTYEVECELVDEDGSYMATRRDEDVAASLMLKARVLMGEEGDADVEVVAARQDDRNRQNKSLGTATRKRARAA